MVVRGRSGVATGVITHIAGRVSDERGRIIAGAPGELSARFDLVLASDGRLARAKPGLLESLRRV